MSELTEGGVSELTEGGVRPEEQLELVHQTRTRLRTAKPKAVEPLAARHPVARVAVDIPLAHLDRLFDYAVPASMADSAVPGCRVRLRFAGRLVNGYVVQRAEHTDHSESPAKLARLQRVVSAEVVLTPQVLAAARSVADHYAGVLADVLRLAIPPRHAAAEAKKRPAVQPPPPKPKPKAMPMPMLQADSAHRPWTDYGTGPAFLRALADGKAPQAVWTALPGPSWPHAIAEAAHATLASGRGALIVVADARDVQRVSAALTDALGDGQHLELTADLGPAERYTRFLAICRGSIRCVVGTRAAQFAPVHDLGLALVWDDGDDLHAEQHAPYPHVREVLAIRAATEHAGLLVGGFSMTAEGRLLIDSGRAHALTPPRAGVRSLAPAVRPAGDDAELARDAAAASARLPHLAWRTAREALALGPVLVQVPRRGYLPSLACISCRTSARCVQCSGPLALSSGHAVPYCRWCGRPSGRFACRECGATKLRASVTGASRTAEELGRAFPGVPVRTSGRDEVLATIGSAPALVVSTPGAEPVAEGGYAAVLLLDGWALLDRPDLRAEEEALRRWLAAAALVRPAGEGGRVVIMADAAHRAVQALVRWDPAWSATRELADRDDLGFPPAAALAEVRGELGAVEEVLTVLDLPAGAGVLGTQPVANLNRMRRDPDGSEPGLVRALIRAPKEQSAALAEALAVVQAGRSARKAPDPIRVRIDPVDVG